MNRRLYRSRSDSILGGVAGGVAEYLDIDPSFVRIAWVILAIITGGILFILYLVMWIVVPEPPEGAAAAGDPAAAASQPAPAAAPAATPRRSTNGAMVFGLILIGVGAWFLLDEYVPDLNMRLLWPIGLVAVGALLLLTSLRRGRE